VPVNIKFQDGSACVITQVYQGLALLFDYHTRIGPNKYFSKNKEIFHLVENFKQMGG
jgi:hypothetical protein